MQRRMMLIAVVRRATDHDAGRCVLPTGSTLPRGENVLHVAFDGSNDGHRLQRLVRR